MRATCDHQTKPANHVLVIVDGSEAARRAVEEGEAMAGEYDALLSVATLVNRDDPRTPCVGCGVSVARWNRMLEEIAQERLEEARRALGARAAEAGFFAVPGVGAAGIENAARALGSDLVLVPSHGAFRRRFVRRVRRRIRASVIEVEA